MKIFSTVMKLLTALATLAGIVYIVATYGEQIVAWAKKMLASLPQCPCCEEAEVVDPIVEEAPAEEEAPAAEEEAPLVEEEAAEEPAPEVVVAENEPVAEEQDFE